jgi:hypothetical protein
MFHGSRGSVTRAQDGAGGDVEAGSEKLVDGGAPKHASGEGCSGA